MACPSTSRQPLTLRSSAIQRLALHAQRCAATHCSLWYVLVRRDSTQRLYSTHWVHLTQPATLAAIHTSSRETHCTTPHWCLLCHQLCHRGKFSTGHYWSFNRRSSQWCKWLLILIYTLVVVPYTSALSGLTAHAICCMPFDGVAVKCDDGKVDEVTKAEVFSREKEVYLLLYSRDRPPFS